MKKPSLRNSDILYVDPDARNEVYDFTRSLKPLLHPFIRDNMVRFEHVGSMTFGNNRLRSDWDFNIAMGDWNDQFIARRIYYGNLGGWRKEVGDAILQFYKKTGLRIDLGAVDCDTQKYNICVDLNTMILHHRYSEYPEVFMADANGIVWERPDEHPIDLKTFNPLTDEAPPVANQHLKWNFMLHRWQRIVLSDGNAGLLVPYLGAKEAEWAEDEWTSEVPKWQEKYGSRFQSYHSDGIRLIQD